MGTPYVNCDKCGSRIYMTYGPEGGYASPEPCRVCHPFPRDLNLTLDPLGEVTRRPNWKGRDGRTD